MDNKKIFDNYLTNHYSKCEKTDFCDSESVKTLLNNNKKVLAHNLGDLFKNNIKKDSKILDLGCGYGSFLYFLKKNGYKSVTGVDISEEEINVCEKLFGTYKLYQQDMFDFIKSTKERFDVVYLSHVLEHIKKENAIDFVESIKNVLTDNGYFIVVAPNSAAYFNSSANRYGDLTHETGITNLSLSQIFMAAGFKRIKMSNFFGAGSLWLRAIRKIFLYFFEIFIQILGYDKQDIYTPSILVIAKK